MELPGRLFSTVSVGSRSSSQH